MNWASLYATIAVAINCPLSEVWQMTMGQLRLYSDAIEDVLPLHNAFAGAKKQEVTPDEAVRMLGLKPRGPNN